MAEIKIGVAGAHGRMGQAVAAVVTARSGVTLAARFNRVEAEGLISRDEALALCDVIIDFTTAAASAELAKAAAERVQSKGSAPALIIGSTGFSPNEERVVRAAAKRLAIVKSGNFSLGVNMLIGLVNQAARALPAADYDIEVFEAHHRRKVDAPSGTALMLGQAAAAGRDQPLEAVRALTREGITGERKAGEIGFSVMRGGGIIGEHSVVFAAEDEILTLSHSARDRGLFARGAVEAAVWAHGRPPGLYDMQDVLGFVKEEPPHAGDLNTLDATALLQALDGRRISALELLDASVAKAHQLKTRINAVVAEDLEPARRRAREIDDRRANGETSASLGLLAGLPMTIKDCLDVDDMPASAGLAGFLDRPSGDAFAVGHARSEGAVIWGKTNVPVMAGDWQSYNSVYGQTNNPWDLERTPGGSSGGAAAALATGITALEIGSDIGGSLRIPASFCGVYSHKPTYGLVSTRGHVPPGPGTVAEPDLNVVGPMARSARDLRLLLSILAGGTVAAKAQPIALAGMKVGLWLDDPAFILDAEVRAVIEAMATDLISEGMVVEPIVSPVDGQSLLDTYLALLMPIIASGFPPGQYAAMKRMRPLARLSMATGRRPAWALQVLNATASHREWLAANEAREKIGRTLKTLFDRYEVIIAPIAPVTAFPHDHSNFSRRTLRCSDNRKIPYDAMLRWIALATTCGLPATAIPAGLSGEGLPVGVQIIGPRGGDSKTLAVAEAIEARLGGFRAPEMG